MAGEGGGGKEKWPGCCHIGLDVALLRLMGSSFRIGSIVVRFMGGGRWSLLKTCFELLISKQWSDDAGG